MRCPQSKYVLDKHQQGLLELGLPKLMKVADNMANYKLILLLFTNFNLLCFFSLLKVEHSRV